MRRYGIEDRPARIHLFDKMLEVWRERLAPAQAIHGLHHEQVAGLLGQGPSRRGPRSGHRRQSPRTGPILTFDGPSLRARHLGLDSPTQAEASTQLARIPGISRLEFPNPHRVLDVGPLVVRRLNEQRVAGGEDPLAALRDFRLP
jgi:hypothetical protein